MILYMNWIHYAWIYAISQAFFIWWIYSLRLDSLFLTIEQAITFLDVPHIRPRSTFDLTKT